MDHASTARGLIDFRESTMRRAVGLHGQIVKQQPDPPKTAKFQGLEPAL
jgi:hypothetical protein